MVLLAAALHAGWNALVKAGGDRTAMMVIVTGATGVLCLAALPFLEPPAPASWPYLATSVALHIGYLLFLAAAYTHGDFGLVYPIARGSGPLIVTVAALVWLREPLPPQALAGAAVVALGICGLALRGNQSLRANPRPVAFALGTGLFIASYTMTDGIGARLAGTPHGYTVWLFAIEAALLVPAVGWWKRSALRDAGGRAWRTGLGGGAMALAAYWIVIWAMTLGPIAPVAALRETSVLIAAVIGAVMFKEPLGRWRLTAAAAVVTGVVVMQV